MSTVITRQDQLIAAYTALAVVIHLLESALPSPIPGIKPGLANVVSLVVLLRFGWRTAAWVVILRVLVSSLLLGSFLSPTFLLSAGGAAASLLAMGFLYSLNQQFKLGFSAYGLAMFSAFAHMSGQFYLAYSLFVPHPGLLTLLPVLLSAALAFGFCSGWLAQQILLRMPAIDTKALAEKL